MIKLFFIVVFIAVMYFIYSEMERKQGVIKAEEELKDSKLKGEELDILKDVQKQNVTNEEVKGEEVE